MLASICLTEDGVEKSSPPSMVLSTWHLSIMPDAMFQEVEFSVGIANLDTNLANMDGDALTHGNYRLEGEVTERTPGPGYCSRQVRVEVSNSMRLQ